MGATELFRIVTLASMHAENPLAILHQNTVFSSSCKLISLRVVPWQVTAKASAPQAPWGMPWFVALQGISGREEWVQKPLICMYFHVVLFGKKHEI